MVLTPITEREFRMRDKILFLNTRKRIKKTAWFLPHSQTTKKSQDK